MKDYDYGYISPMYTVFRTSNSVDSDFLYLLLRSNFYLEIYKSIGEGSINRRKSITFTNLSRLNVALPPLQEQQKIGSILSNIDNLIQKIDQIIEQAQRLKKGLMQRLLTKGIGHTKFRITELGEIPEEWTIKKVEEIAEIIMGQSPLGNSYNVKGEGIPLLNGPTEFGLEYPTPIQYTTKPTKRCIKDDILLCVRGSTTGRLNLANDIYCIGRGLCAIRGIKNITYTR